MCLLGLGCYIKTSHSKEGQWFRALLRRWNMDLLFLTQATTKEELVPREGGWLTSVQCPLLYFGTRRNTHALH